MATVKKASTPEAEPLDDDDLLPEYDPDYSKGRPNRYAGQIDWSQDVILVHDETAPDAGSILAPDAIEPASLDDLQAEVASYEAVLSRCSSFARRTKP